MSEASLILKVRVPRHTPLAQHLESLGSGKRAKEILALSQLGFLISRGGAIAASAPEGSARPATPAADGRTGVPKTQPDAPPSGALQPQAIPTDFVNGLLEFESELLAGRLGGAA